jgi:hypothetical protein
VGSVELDVLVAEPRELGDLLAQGLGAVAQEALQARIGTAGALRIVKVGEQLGLAARGERRPGAATRASWSGRASVAKVVSPADTGGGHRFHSAEQTSDDGRVAWPSVSRLNQRWQPPGLTDLLQSHRLIDQPSTCLAMCSCPDLSRRSERRLDWFVGSVLVAASTSSNSARGPSASAESNDHSDNWRLGHRRGRHLPRAHGGLAGP